MGKHRLANVAQSVEQLIRNQQVSGPSPLIGSIFFRGVAQFGSAFGSGPKGRWFKSSHLDHPKKPQISEIQVFFFFANLCSFCVFSHFDYILTIFYID